LEPKLAELNVALRLSAIGKPLRMALQIASQLGVRAIELDARHEIIPSQLSDTGLRQLRKMLDDLNLRVASLRFQTRRGYDNPRDLEQRVEATKQTMQLAYRLGAPVVVNQIGRVPDHEDDAVWDSFRSVMNDLGRYGARVGALLAAETGTESGEQLSKFLGDADDAFVAVALNPGQLIINRHDVRAAIMALKHRIQIVHAVDGVLDLAAGRGLAVPLGQGTADFPELIGLLEDIQFRGAYVVGREDARPGELQQGIEYLKSL